MKLNWMESLPIGHISRPTISKSRHKLLYRLSVQVSHKCNLETLKTRLSSLSTDNVIINECFYKFAFMIWEGHNCPFESWRHYFHVSSLGKWDEKLLAGMSKCFTNYHSNILAFYFPNLSWVIIRIWCPLSNHLNSEKGLNSDEITTAHCWFNTSMVTSIHRFLN